MLNLQLTNLVERNGGQMSQHAMSTISLDRIGHKIEAKKAKLSIHIDLHSLCETLLIRFRYGYYRIMRLNVKRS